MQVEDALGKVGISQVIGAHGNYLGSVVADEAAHEVVGDGGAEALTGLAPAGKA